MIDRSRLHELIDSLPEAALAVAQGALENFQVWPPQRRPPQLAAFEKANINRMRRAMTPGTLGSGGGGGGHFIGPGGRIEYGNHSHSHWEGDTFVSTTHRFHAGNEIVVEERTRIADHSSRLIYTHSVTGPGGINDQREIKFLV